MTTHSKCIWIFFGSPKQTFVIINTQMLCENQTDFSEIFDQYRDIFIGKYEEVCDLLPTRLTHISIHLWFILNHKICILYGKVFLLTAFPFSSIVEVNWHHIWQILISNIFQQQNNTFQLTGFKMYSLHGSQSKLNSNGK